MRRKQIWMYRGGQTVESFEDRMGGGVEKLVWNAIDATVCHRAQGLPAALLDDASQGNAIAGTAPGEDENVWVTGGNGLRSGGFAWFSDELAASGFDQFLHPGLGMNERLAPLLAIYAGRVGCCCRVKANGLDAGGEFGDQLFGAIGGVNDGADQADVSENVGGASGNTGQPARRMAASDSMR